MVKRFGQLLALMTSLCQATATSPPQLSEAATLSASGAGTRLAHCTVSGAGQVSEGAIVSTKVMCWTQVMVLPQLSVARQVRSMPSRPVQLGGVEESVKVIAGVPPQSSVAVAGPVLAGAVEAPQASCLSGGQVIT